MQLSLQVNDILRLPNARETGGESRMKDDISRVRLSYGRAIAKSGFLSRFYDIFLASDRAIARKFVNTDLEKQQELLAMSVNMVILFPQENKIAKNAVGRIRKSHCREGLNIEPRFYGLWKSSLIEAVSEHDMEYNPQIGDSWEKVLQIAIDHIVEGY
ncbi:hypothetical protein MNBD_GAMMA17-624 [hydrothermal vent metagenome]|uniref:Globin family profile domain-containing protein n=1 Tax=hydrothermal vent metagenome TaxID=652676 RepID=A0A3B0YWW5_9ZZZZ